MREKKNELNEIIARIQEKAATDAEFRALCLSSPYEAAKREGLEMPPGLQINVVENAGADLTIVLPDFIDSELQDKELNDVAGGRVAQPFPFQ